MRMMRVEYVLMGEIKALASFYQEASRKENTWDT
jgi:hypothetical protein